MLSRNFVLGGSFGSSCVAGVGSVGERSALARFFFLDSIFYMQGLFRDTVTFGKMGKRGHSGPRTIRHSDVRIFQISDFLWYSNSFLIEPLIQLRAHTILSIATSQAAADLGEVSMSW